MMTIRFFSISKKKSIAKPPNSNKIEAAKSMKNVSVKAAGESLFSVDENSDADLFGSSSAFTLLT